MHDTHCRVARLSADPDQGLRTSAIEHSQCSGRRLTGRSPGQAPFLVPLEEAQLLRRIRHQEILRLLAVQGSDGR